MRRRDRLLVGMLVGLGLAATLGPLVIGVVQVIRDQPSPEHLGLALFGLLGEAFTRLLWSVGVGIIVFVLRTAVAALQRQQGFPPAAEFARGIRYARDTLPT